MVETSGEKVIRRLYEITQNYDQGFEAQINQLLKMGLERFNLDIAILSKIQNGKYTVKHCVVPDEVELASGVDFDLDTTYCHITCDANSPVAIEHMGENDAYASHPSYQSFGLESYIGVPIKLNGKLYGTLNFSSPELYPRKFKDIDIDVLQLMASWIEVEIIRRRQEKALKRLNLELEKKAYEDSLTGVANRRQMFRHLNQDLNRVCRNRGTGVLALLDIDFFKQVNDDYGHQKGDKILTKVVQCISSTKRDYDFVARFGGEEFLIWFPETKLDDAKKISERIRSNISKLELLDKPLTVSLGLTKYNYHHADHLNVKVRINELISQADKALYQAKENGRNCVVCFE